MNFYFDAAKALDQLDGKRGSIKSVIGGLPEKTRKRTAALVIETLKFKTVLSDVIKASYLMRDERQRITSHNLALLLVHDLLLSRGIQAGDGPIKQAVLRHKTRMHAELQKIKIKRGVTSTKDLAEPDDPRAASIPRYARINRNIWTLEEALNHFTSAGFVRNNDPFQSINSMALDEHLPDLLAFHPNSHLIEDTSYQTGKIILQDKASCIPAVVLNPPATDKTVVIDATAAPGNKTTHLSALMRNRGKIFAFERDSKRFLTLRKMIANAKCENVESVHSDFLSLSPSDQRFSTVTHILLDPSCSGSGIVNRLDHLLETDDEIENMQDERLHKLSAFQLTMIKHAMKFPAVDKIVYSTCSIHPIENEQVVAEALGSEEAKLRDFTLAPREDVLPTWPRRGIDKMGSAASVMTAAEASCLVRCSPEDHTNGFFVSCFVRRRPPPKEATHSAADIHTESSTPKPNISSPTANTCGGAIRSTTVNYRKRSTTRGEPVSTARDYTPVEDTPFNESAQAGMNQGSGEMIKAHRKSKKRKRPAGEIGDGAHDRDQGHVNKTNNSASCDHSSRTRKESSPKKSKVHPKKDMNVHRNA